MTRAPFMPPRAEIPDVVTLPCHHPASQLVPNRRTMHGPAVLTCGRCGGHPLTFVTPKLRATAAAGAVVHDGYLAGA